jgi:hypothetical protein
LLVDTTMPRARVQTNRSRYRFDLLDEEYETPNFALGPSLLQVGGSPGAGAAAAPAAAAPFPPPRLPVSTLGLQTSFADLATELLSVAGAGSAGGGGGGGGGGQAAAWDTSAFASAAGAPGALPLAPGLLEGAGAQKKRLVLDALHRAHDSEAGAVSEKLHRQELSTRRRCRLLTSIASAEAYRGRAANKGMKKLAARRRLRQARGE